jgi:hypothetical protein
LAIGGGVLVALLPGESGRGLWRWVGVGLLLLAALVTLGVLRMLRLPRIAYERGELLVYLRGMSPLRVPIDLVECFFLGSAPSGMPGAKGERAKATSIVVRLAERAEDWRDRDVNPALGEWRCGYITIRGTWCETITPEKMQRLNDRLIGAHRELKQGGKVGGG